MDKLSKNLVLVVLTTFILSLCMTIPVFAVTPPFQCNGYITPDCIYSFATEGTILSGFKVECIETGQSATTGTNGYFYLDCTGHRSISIKISKQGYLTRVISNIPVDEMSYLMPPIKMWAGDMPVNSLQDNAINMVDIMFMARFFNLANGDGGYVPTCDINVDNAINMTDVMIAAKHFNKTTQDYSPIYLSSPTPFVTAISTMPPSPTPIGPVFARISSVTERATNITSTSATISGTVSLMDTVGMQPDIALKLVYWEEDSPDNKIEAAKNGFTFYYPAKLTANLKNLKPDTVYQYQLEVTGPSGEVLSFKTLTAAEDALPVVGSFENLIRLVTPAPSPTPTKPNYVTFSPSPTPYIATYREVPDIAKTDGKYIYQLNKDRICITKAYPPGEMEYISQIPGPGFNPTEMFLEGEKLIVIGTSETSDSIRVMIYDASNKRAIKELRSISLGGKYISHKKVDSMLYLTTCKSFNIYYGDTGDSSRIRPYYTDSLLGSQIQYIPYSDIKYFPEFTKPNYFMTFGLNMDDFKENMHISTYLGAGQDAFMAENNIYTAVNDYKVIPSTTSIPATLNTDNTMVYKFSLYNEKFVFNNKSEVPGKIVSLYGMRDYDAGYRMADEYDDSFRIVTASGEARDSYKYHLSVLDKNMKITGKLEDLGTGKSIRSIRFEDKKVIAEIFDNWTYPLSVIDLKEPSNPKMLGKLNIPNLVAYHFYDENHIIGLVQNSNSKELTFIDISDLANPVIKFHEATDCSWGTLDSLLLNKEKNLWAFPVLKLKSDGTLDFQGIEKYNIDKDNGFRYKGRLSHMEGFPEQDLSTYWIAVKLLIERVLYIDDTIYTISKRIIKANEADDLGEVNSIVLPRYSYW